MPLARVFRVDVGPVLLLLFGAFTMAGSAFNLWSELALRRSWPQIEGVSRGAVTYSTGSGTKSSNVRVTFDYVVDGVPHVSTTQYEKSMEGYYANQKTLTFAPGTRHRIWYRPGDPKEIRLDFDDTSRMFGAGVGLVILGPLGLIGGALMIRKQRSGKA